MKRTIFLALALLVAPAALAQSQSSAQPQQEQKPAAKQPTPPDAARPNGQAEPELATRIGHPLGGAPAPKKGHPLDWRDVDILTGKAGGYAQRDSRGYAGAPVYVDAPGGGSRFGYSQFGASQFAPVSTEVFPLPRAAAFGGIGTRRFGVRGRVVGSGFVFLPRFSRRTSTFFIFP